MTLDRIGHWVTGRTGCVYETGFSEASDAYDLLTLFRDRLPDSLDVMKRSWLNSIVFGLVSGCSTPLEPDAVSDADPSDVVVSGSGPGTGCF